MDKKLISNDCADRAKTSVLAPHLIKSKDNDFFKKIKSYCVGSSSAKYRKGDNCLIAEGEKTYREALAVLNLRNTIVSESYFDSTDADLSHSTVFADNLFDSISELKTSQGILGIFDVPHFDINTASLSRVVILEGIQDPNNIGAIIRNAHCLGFEAVFLGEGCARPFSPKVIRSSMGSVFHIPVIAGTTLEQIQELREQDFSIVGTAMSGNEEVRPFEKVAILIGSEGSGLSAEALELCDYNFKIKMHNKAESLNAAVASGIAMYLFAGQG
jgi:TrmH family RNA methyltransferase